MDLASSVYDSVSSIGSTFGYYWGSLKNTVMTNYYYYFPPKPQQMVFMMIEGADNGEITIVTDDLGNSVFKE